MVFTCNQKINNEFITQNGIDDYDTIRIKNTVNQTSSDIKTIKTYCKVHVIGGYDTEKEKRYDNEIHLKRNTYTIREFAKILAGFENIEKNIDPNWSDLAKALYIYYTLRREMNYAESELQSLNDPENYIHEAIDCEIRSLRGIIHKRAVCAGFAQIYKEFLERQGINCKYRAIHGKHAWNEVEIDGKYYPVDLTLEIVERSKRLTLKYFMNNPEFYDDPMHKANDVEGECVSRTLSEERIKNAQLEIFETIQKREHEDDELE